MTQPARPNLTAGIVGAAVGALVGAIAWAVLTSVTGYKIGYAAVGVGALTGLLAGRLGGGAAQLPPISAAIGLVGCVLGDLFTDAHAVVEAVNDNGGDVSVFRVLKEMVQHPSGFAWPLYKDGFGALDVLFYGFAAVAAFQLATKHGLLHSQPAPPAWEPPTGPPAEPGGWQTPTDPPAPDPDAPRT